MRDDCRHYLARTTTAGDVFQRCRLKAAEEHPFACPEGCMFFEGRVISTAGFATAPDQPMTSTAWGIARLPPPPPGTRTSGSKAKRRGRRQR